LRRKYGEPISETFVVRPGITVTATYAADWKITEFLIAPDTSGPAIVKSSGIGLSRESVDTIIDELVPPSTRGKQVFGEFINATCLPANDCNGTAQIYEKITVYYNAAPEMRVYYAVVKWKDTNASRPQ